MSSRNEVDLHRTFKFINSKQTWTGIPIIAANMDTTGRDSEEMKIKNAEVKKLIFSEALRQANNMKNGQRTLESFF
jgi:hypothetical protein